MRIYTKDLKALELVSVGNKKDISSYFQIHLKDNGNASN